MKKNTQIIQCGATSQGTDEFSHTSFSLFFGNLELLIRLVTLIVKMVILSHEPSFVKINKLVKILGACHFIPIFPSKP